MNGGAARFEDQPVVAAGQVAQAAAPVAASGRARVVRRSREQTGLRPTNLESLLPERHRTRSVWVWIEPQGLSVTYAPVKVREGGVERSAISSEILFALRLYATLEGEGSAAAVGRLVLQHGAYRLLRDGVPVNDLGLPDLRVAHGTALDEVLSTSLTALRAVRAVQLKRFAQDGGRASAGAASFRRRGTPQECLDKAQTRVQALEEQIDGDPVQGNRRTLAARARAEREREQRLKEALERLSRLEHANWRQGTKVDTARASTTDGEAIVMRTTADGFRPAYSAQFASDREARVVVGMEVTSAGSNMAQLQPMVEKVQGRCGQVTAQRLVDGCYPAHEEIEVVVERTEVSAPVPEQRMKKDERGDAIEQDGHLKPDDSVAVAAWRQRTTQPAAQKSYRERASVAECVNAKARSRGLNRLPVRGLTKLRCVALVHARAPQLLGLDARGACSLRAVSARRANDGSRPRMWPLRGSNTAPCARRGRRGRCHASKHRLPCRYRRTA